MRFKTNKLQKLERNRFSIYTDNFKKCYYCGKTGKMDKHEVYGGANRIRSMQNGLVVPLCRACHSNEMILNKLKIKCQKIYEQEHTREEFIQLIGKNYIQERREGER